MQINLYKQNLNFNAKYISEWNCTNFDGCIKKIKVIKFEKEDINFLNSYYKDIENIMHIDDIKKIFIKSSIQTILEVLNSDDSSVFQKTKLYGAIYKNKLCGLLIANIPKLKSYNYKESYSSRHNSAKKEAEIDWLVTWFPEKQILINGIGKALVGQFFNTLKKNKLRDVFVKSEIPELSYALNFYEKLGFEQIGNKWTRLSNKNSGKCIINNYSNSYDLVIPMIITSKKIKSTIKYLHNKMHPKKLPETHFELK